MTDHKQPAQNDSNHSTVHSPNKPGQVEKVDPTTGGSAGTIDTHKK